MWSIDSLGGVEDNLATGGCMVDGIIFGKAEIFCDFFSQRLGIDKSVRDIRMVAFAHGLMEVEAVVCRVFAEQESNRYVPLLVFFVQRRAVRKKENLRDKIAGGHVKPYSPYLLVDGNIGCPSDFFSKLDCFPCGNVRGVAHS